MDMTTSPPGSCTVTQGVRISVTPEFLPAKSDATAGRYTFAYHIVIANEGDRRAKLRSRHWIILDAHGVRRDVHGMGVVGAFPDLAPGEQYQYSSFCPLETHWGTMEGTFLMERETGETFDAAIGRFYLIAPAAETDRAGKRVKTN